ncbi:SIR2 family protein [Acinetobacter dispersus]|uniref:Uncharacterized protein n=1 Tax=Acinetobacter dispersus TaxID=70348 RepID=N9MSD1_9GAMM|nr:SIR2 family protein [Acinetobacter dispersus]ENW92829.1 hypothetical protein F904_02772 [Acinetobacter dispersus]
MDIFDFVGSYKNHPVLFIGSGFSLRYLKNSYNWPDLLKKIAVDLTGSDEFYLDLRQASIDAKKDECNLMLLAGALEEKFNQELINDRNGKFKNINDKFYELSRTNKSISRFKLYVCELLKDINYKENVDEEVHLFKKMSKNISSIITTNYDLLLEELVDFIPLIGNEILLSNPYGTIYKIHGCINNPNSIILTNSDYAYFDQKYDLIRAQLISLFVHNPIIFLGYSVQDENIQNILNTIFRYVPPNSEQAKKIKRNFLLVEYEPDLKSAEISEHDIYVDGNLISINKVKTDNFKLIYKAIYDLALPISAMDIRKVQEIVKEITSGGTIKVSIADDIETLKNSDKVLAIGSTKNIKYEIKEYTELCVEYFDLIEDGNIEVIKLIDKKMKIASSNWFPINGFVQIVPDLKSKNKLTDQLNRKVSDEMKRLRKIKFPDGVENINDIYKSEDIVASNKLKAIAYLTYMDKIKLDDLKSFLINFEDKNTSDFRKLLSFYDYKKFKIKNIIS